MQLWRSLFGHESSSALRREMMIPILAYRIQEQAFGGLRESTARKLRELADECAAGDAAVHYSLRPKSGVRYVREYDGKLHEVTVLDSGFENSGQTYRSLTILLANGSAELAIRETHRNCPTSASTEISLQFRCTRMKFNFAGNFAGF